VQSSETELPGAAMERHSDYLLTLLKDASYYPDGITLLRVGKNPGLLSSKSGPVYEAAQQALQAKYLEIVKQEGKADAVRLTALGETYLREHQDPRKSLEELLHQLRLSEQGMPRWLADIEAQLAAFRLRCQTFLEQQGQTLHQLIARAEAALRRLEGGPLSESAAALVPWQVEALNILKRQAASGHQESPLPWLFNALQQADFSHLTIPDFHAGLQVLQDRGSISLLPPPASLPTLAEPEYALVCDGIIYYSARIPG
jgi:hypothetical protein